MRRNIEINAEGCRLSGWLYLPDDFTAPVPAVVMAHGFSAVKEMFLDAYAERFCRAGLAAVVFDHRGFGASEGAPRQEVDPVAQIRDYRHALTFAAGQPEIDAQRLGVWGSSYSGGHALMLGWMDARVKCVVSQAPLISGWRNVRRLVRADLLPGLRAMCDADRAARFAGQAPALIPVVADDPTVPAAFPGTESWSWFSETANTRAPAWRNEVTLRSFEMLMEYEPGAHIERISPTPLLMIVARNDTLAVADEALAAYQRALEPKRLVLLDGGHFDAYGKDFETSAQAACEWFRSHLGPKAR
jgi:uncharacterized protein